MAERRPSKKTKPGEPIAVTAQQLESFMFEHKANLIHVITISSDVWS